MSIGKPTLVVHTAYFPVFGDDVRDDPERRAAYELGRDLHSFPFGNMQGVASEIVTGSLYGLVAIPAIRAVARIWAAVLRYVMLAVVASHVVLVLIAIRTKRTPLPAHAAEPPRHVRIHLAQPSPKASPKTAAGAAKSASPVEVRPKPAKPRVRRPRPAAPAVPQPAPRPLEPAADSSSEAAAATGGDTAAGAHLGGDGVGAGSDGVGAGSDGVGAGSDGVGSGSDGVGSGSDGVAEGSAAPPPPVAIPCPAPTTMDGQTRTMDVGHTLICDLGGMRKVTAIHLVVGSNDGRAWLLHAELQRRQRTAGEGRGLR